MPDASTWRTEFRARLAPLRLPANQETAIVEELAQDAEDRLDGALLGLYRHVGNHVKVGAGYNFSKFSDDLTSLDFRHQGLFINIIGKM